MEYTNAKGQKYFLHSTIVILRGGDREQTIYYFAKVVNSEKVMKRLPKGFKIVENPKTGLPCLKRA